MESGDLQAGGSGHYKWGVIGSDSHFKTYDLRAIKIT